MTERYRFHYDDASVYGRVVHLLRAHGRPTGVVVDLGCGFGAIAEACREVGYGYLGFDVDPAGPKDLVERGFEGSVVDLGDPVATEQAVLAQLGNREVAAITLLDTIEHLLDPDAALAMLRRIAERVGAPLVVSVPNVSHLDIAVKLLVGRWDVTTSGLLDDTHVAFYNDARLAAVFGRCGWAEIGAADFELRHSDQHFPADLVALSQATQLGQLLRQVRTASGPHAFVNQFVRAYLPGPVTGPEPTDEAGPEPFLSILTRTQGRRLATLADALLCLAAQTDQDFELLVLAHEVAPEALADVRRLVADLSESFAAKVRVLDVRGGGRSRPLNVGVAAARGRYVAVLDDDDLVLAHWVEEFHRYAEEFPGRIVRAVVSEQQVEFERQRGVDGWAAVSRIRCPWPAAFNLLDHFVDNATPLCGLAFPASLFRDLGTRFDESLPVLEDWDLLLRAAPLCGVVATAEVTSVYRRWQHPEAGHSVAVHGEEEWEATRQTILGRLNAEPMIFPPGSVNRIRADWRGEPHGTTALAAELRRLRGQIADAERRVGEIAAEFTDSTSWRLSRPVRALGGLALRLRRAGR